MKKIILLTALALTVVLAKADIGATVMLKHNGQATMFAWDQVQQAVDAAVDGDTIYLTNGQFSSFNVTKRIMVRGTGSDTTIQGSCTVYISGSSPLTMPVLDALTFTGDVSVTCANKQFTIRKCQMNNLSFTENDFRDVKLYQCNILGTLHLTQKVKEFNCFNTKIHTLLPYDYTNGDARFDHCNIRAITDTITATFDNCVLRFCKAEIVGKSGYYGVCLNNCKLNYCIYPPVTSNPASTNSSYSRYLENGAYHSGNEPFFFNPTVCFSNCYQLHINKENVVNYGSNSYLGSDGTTMVGCYGGATPYRLTPELPRVTKHSVVVDAENKKLNVTLTLTKE